MCGVHLQARMWVQVSMCVQRPCELVFVHVLCLPALGSLRKQSPTQEFVCRQLILVSDSREQEGDAGRGETEEVEKPTHRCHQVVIVVDSGLSLLEPPVSCSACASEWSAMTGSPHLAALTTCALLAWLMLWSG